MASLRKNVAGQNIPFQLTDKSTGDPVTAGGAGNVTIDNGSQNACAGTFTHKGSGQWNYVPTQAETNGTSIGFQFTGTNAITIGVSFFTDNWDTTQSVITAGTGTNQLAVSGGDIAGDVLGSVDSVTNPVDANLVAIGGSVTDAVNLSKTTAAIGRGVVTTGASISSVPTSAFTPNGASTDQFVGRTMLFDANTATAGLRGEAAAILASTNASNPTFTVSNLSAAPSSGDTFSVV